MVCWYSQFIFVLMGYENSFKGKKTKFPWSEETQKIFDLLKLTLTNIPISAHSITIEFKFY